MARLLAEGFRWPGMEEDCAKAAREYVDCQRYTVQKYGFHPLRTISASLPMDHLAIDLASLPTSSSGMNYILLAIDICTRFAWLYPLESKRGTDVARALHHLFTSFGRPLIIQSDNGTEFANLDFDELMSLAGVEKRRVSPYHPQGNGAAERLVRTIKESIFALIRGDTSSWDKRLPEVQYTYNTTAHSRHGSTPYSLLFARSHNPWHAKGPSVPPEPASESTLQQRMEWMTNFIFPAMAEKTDSYAKRMYDDFARRHKIVREDYPAGALVMRQVVPRGSKASPAWEGPYLVQRRNRGGAYFLRDATSAEITAKVPASQLRLVSPEGNLSPDSFEVKEILDHRGPEGRREYLIRWTNFSDQYNTWVPERDINTLGCVTEYWDKERAKQRTTPASRRGRKAQSAQPIRNSELDPRSAPREERAHRRVRPSKEASPVRSTQARRNRRRSPSPVAAQQRPSKQRRRY